MSWQPIETAPQVGTFLLFGRIAGEVTGEYERPYICIGEFSGRSDYPGFDWVCHGTDAYAVWCKPTHWQRLPEPPEPA